MAMLTSSMPRITINPAQMNATPCIRGLRIPVATVVGMLGDGMTEGDVLDAFPDLELEDLRVAFHHAAAVADERDEI